MLLSYFQRQRLKHWKELAYKGICRFFVLLSRPFVDFYCNAGLSRASVLAYVLCANLVIFIYLVLGLAIFLETFTNPDSLRRFLELHLLWPSPTKILIKEAPTNFGLSTRDLVTKQEYEEALVNYCQKHKTTPARLQEEGKLETEDFSITQRLSMSIHQALHSFREKPFPLTIGIFIVLAIAYIALLFNIKTNLAESVSPLIWGNFPLAHRSSELMKILWRIPHVETISKRLSLFFMLPFLVTVAISLLFTCHKLIDGLVEPYTTLNDTFTLIVSFVITGLLFTSLYKLHVTDISQKYAAVGAFIASGLWLGGRWFFTQYGAVSLYLNLRNFAFVPIALTWFYYLCMVFLFGIYVAYTLENSNLSTIARFWVTRDIAFHTHYSILAQWVRLDFLYRLARNRNEDSYKPPFIGINNTKGDVAEVIARLSCLPAPFVRESILDMIAHHPTIFCVEVEGNRQYCKLKLPPEEVDIIPLVTDHEEGKAMLKEMEDYEFGHFIVEQYGYFWKANPIKLSEVYKSYKDFQKQIRPLLPNLKIERGKEEIFL